MSWASPTTHFSNWRILSEFTDAGNDYDFRLCARTTGAMYASSDTFKWILALTSLITEP